MDDADGGAGRLAGRPWWHPSPISGCFIGIVLLDAALLLIAFNVTFSSSDGAGNGLAMAIQQAFVELGAIAVGVVAFLFLVIRHRVIRITLTLILGVMTLPLMLLLH